MAYSTQLSILPSSTNMFRFFLVAAFLGLVWGAPQSLRKNQDLDGRIVGGWDTTIESHPYIVSLLEYNWHICGGSIISSTWILTAAHCFYEDVSAYSVRSGSTIRNSGGQVVQAKDVILHPQYNSYTIDYDIALVELVGPISIAVARAVGLAPEGGPPTAGTIATITGWGALSEGGASASNLQVVQVPIISQANCQAAYGAAFITDRMFCAGELGVGGRDACQGDSGGPLIANGMLTGIVSWGYGCARPNSPGVYSSVPNLRAWIRSVSGI